MKKLEVLKYANDIEQMGNHFLMYCERGKIERFEKRYGKLITVLRQKHNDLQNEHFVIENGQLKMEEKEGKRVYVMKEGKTEEDYYKSHQDYFSKEA